MTPAGVVTPGHRTQLGMRVDLGGCIVERFLDSPKKKYVHAPLQSSDIPNSPWEEHTILST